VLFGDVFLVGVFFPGGFCVAFAATFLPAVFAVANPPGKCWFAFYDKKLTSCNSLCSRCNAAENILSVRTISWTSAESKIALCRSATSSPAATSHADLVVQRFNSTRLRRSKTGGLSVVVQNPRVNFAPG